MPKRLPDEVLLGRVTDAAERLGRPPRAHDVPTFRVIIRRFGSWNGALLAAGLEPVKPLRASFLLDKLREKAIELGRTPKLADMNADPHMPVASTYIRKFGGYRIACELAGLDLSHLPAPARTYANPTDAHLQRTFGITEADYNRMSDTQGHRCAGCGLPESKIHNRNGLPQRLSVDHCHATGAVRGLLCNRCNNLLGQASDDPAVLRALADYLDRAQGA